MRKTRRILAVTALLLLAAMLFSSCGLNYAKADMAKYVSIEESGYKGITLPAKIDKTVVREETLRKAILESLRTKLTEGNTVDEKGEINKYDEVYLHTFAVDEDGAIIMTTLNWNKENNSIGSAETLLIGYGVNTGLLEEVEEKLYDETDPANPVKTLLENHMIFDVKETDKSKLIPDGAIIFASYASISSTNVSGSSSGTSIVTINTGLYQGKEQGQNDYYEAISLALAKINANKDGTTNHDGVNVGSVTVNIFPTATPDAEITAEEDDSKINLKYDIDFDNKNGTAYDKGTLTLTIKSAVYLGEAEKGSASEGFKAEPIVMDYTFPSDTSGQYTKKDGTKVDVKNTKATVYLYLTGKTSYEIPEYDNPVTDEQITALKEAIADKDLGNFASDIADITELKKAYEAHVRAELEKDYIEAAEAAALEAIWDAVVSNATVLKRSKYNEYTYVQNIMDNLKLYYSSYTNYFIVDRGSFTANGFSFGSSYAIGTPEQSRQYSGYREYALEMYKEEGYNVETFDQLKDILYAEAQLAVKEMMMTYYMAGLLGIDTGDEKYTQRRDADFEHWKEENRADYIKEYGYFPYISVEDYEEMYGGRENLRGAYLLEEVKEKLFELNKDKVVYNEKYPETSAK